MKYSDLEAEVNGKIGELEGILKKNLDKLADRDGGGHKTTKTLTEALADVQRDLDSVNSYVDKKGDSYKHADFNSFCACYDKCSKNLVVADGYQTREAKNPVADVYSGFSGKHFNPSLTMFSVSGTGVEVVLVGASLVFRGFAWEPTAFSFSGKIGNINFLINLTELTAIRAAVSDAEVGIRALANDIVAVRNNSKAILADRAPVASATSGLSLYYV